MSWQPKMSQQRHVLQNKTARKHTQLPACHVDLFKTINQKIKHAGKSKNM